MVAENDITATTLSDINQSDNSNENNILLNSNPAKKMRRSR